MLPLARAAVHTAPQAPARTYIGVSNWLWVPQTQWQTLSKRVRAGATAVTVRAVPEQVLWRMGVGSTRCYSAGAVWRTGMGDDATSSCKYVYHRTSHAEARHEFEISSTIRYHATWTCTGACTQATGDLGLLNGPEGRGAMRVLQRQTVVTE